MRKKTFLVAFVLLVAPVAEAQALRPRCQKDALEQWYCAADPKGTAVRDVLGEVVCAPGRCLELDGEWQCAADSGGGVQRTPEGPECAGGCRAPRSVDCERMPGPV